MRTKKLLLSVLALCLSVSMAFAAGTRAGTEITNQAFGTYYDTNENLYEAESEVVTTTVSQVAGVGWITTPQEKLILGGETVAFALTLTNTGNGPDEFSLDLDSDDTGGATSTAKVYFDTNGNGALDSGEDEVTDNIELAEDASVDLVVVVTNTGGADEEYNITKVIATSDLADSVTATAELKTTVKLPVFTFTMSAVPTNPEPGDPVTFEIKVQNTGTGIAKNVDVNSEVATSFMESVTDLKINGDAPASGQTASYDDITGIVSFSLGTLNPGSDEVTLTFVASVMGDVGSGVTIPYSASLDHDNDNTPPTAQATIFTEAKNLTVSESLGVAFEYVSGLKVNYTPKDTVSFTVKLKNEGNAAHSYNITTVDDSSWTWKIYNSEGNAIDTIKINAFGDVVLTVASRVPVKTRDEVENELTLTATNRKDNTDKATDTYTVKVAAPNLSLHKSRDKATARPGEEITYTVKVTNYGSGVAQNIKITDPIPANTTFKIGSIKTRTGGSGEWAPLSETGILIDDELVFSLSELASEAIVEYSFQVTVD